MKRPILGLLAAAVFSLGLLGSPVSAATSRSLTAATTPAHDSGEDHGHKYSAHDGQGGTRHHDHDDDGHHGDRRRRCSGLIVICLV